jgi:hypothetical protein
MMPDKRGGLGASATQSPFGRRTLQLTATLCQTVQQSITRLV